MDSEAGRVELWAVSEAATRVSLVANGKTINGTYKMLPFPAIDAFRADLKAILSALQHNNGERNDG